MATRIYQNLVAGKLDACSAVQEAQLWLRGVTNYKLSGTFDQLYARLPPTRKASKGIIMALAEKYGTDPRPHDRPFAEPFFWAPYVATGA